jgi:hypothetical protein
MARRKNVKRIDPRYFLHETVNRGEELEEGWGWRKEDDKELEEGCPHAEEGGEAIDISAPGMEVHVDDISQLSPEEAFAAGMAAARDAIDQAMGVPDGPPPEEAEGIPLQEREGETPEDIAARLKNIPATMRAGAVNDFFNMMDGSTEMAGHYPHVEDHAEFALQVLKLLGEVPASFRPF